MLIRAFTVIAIALGLAGCVEVETATRNQPLELALAPAEFIRSYTVEDVRAVVPETLKVSEANVYYPMADIVWRGDAYGDRHDQIADMFEVAAARQAETLQGDIPVVAEIVLSRFHGVTQKTRYSVGGIYNIVFTLTVRNAETGAIIEGPRLIEANLPAPGGRAAIALDEIGQTERVRVTDFLAMVLARELGAELEPYAGPV